MPVEYRERIPSMQELLKLKKEGKLNAIQKQWFRMQKPKEELFDCKADPFELNNLADNPQNQEKLKELSKEMDRWLNKVGDDPDLPEAELISKLWNGNKTQPKTSVPIITNKNGKVVISCETEGASIGYKIIDSEGKSKKLWLVYQEPFELSKYAKLQVKAHRIGFLSSDNFVVKSRDLK